MSFVGDVRYGLRALRKTPAATGMAILTLTVAMGTNTALFSVVDAAMLRPFPYAEPARLVWIDHTVPAQGLYGVPVGYPNVADWRRRSHSYADVVAFRYAAFVLGGPTDRVRVPGLRVGAGLFELLGVPPARGRAFLPSDDLPGAAEVAIISHGLWERRFGGRSTVLGEAIEVDRVVHTIVGVMPPGFQFPEVADVWVPLRVDESSAPRRERSYRVIARLRPGVTPAAAQSELRAISGELERTYPADNAGLGVRVIPLRQFYIDDERPALLLALAAGALVLVIGCANVAGLLLSRGVARAREMAMRAALGASRARIARQLLLEGAILALLAMGPGLWLAARVVSRLPALIPMRLPFWMSFEIDARTLVFTMASCAAAVVVFGSAPLVSVWRLDLYSALREAGAGATGVRATALRRTLLAAEVALAVVVMIGASLLLRTLAKLERVDPGFRAADVLTMQVHLPVHDARDQQRQVAFFDELAARAGALPGVKAVGVTSALPLRGGLVMRSFTIAGRPATEGAEVPVAACRAVGPGYFQAMGIPLLAGRLLATRDDADSAGGIVISRRMADRFWPAGGALGARIELAGPQVDARWREVVGVVGDVREAWFGPDPNAVVYMPLAQATLPSATLVARAQAARETLFSAFRRVAQELDPGAVVGEIVSMQRVVDESFWKNRLYAVIFAFCAGVAVALAASGVFALASYTVELRAREWAVRSALGASRGELMRAAVRHSLTPALVGAAAGLGLALPACAATRSLLFGVTPFDPVAFTVAPLGLVLAALAAGLVPAARAAAVDPTGVLRA